MAPGGQDGGSDVASAVHGPLAAIRPELHREFVGGLGNDRHWPRQFAPVVGQVRQELHHGAAGCSGGGHGVDAGAPLG